MASWGPLLRRYYAYARDFELQPSPPATPADLQALRQGAFELGVELDPAYVRFLQATNGTGFDGLRIYGANISDDDEDGRFDFIRANALIEERGQDVIFGEWQDDFLVGLSVSGRYERRSKVTADVRTSYDSLDDMLADVLSEECDLLKVRFGAVGVE